MSVSRMRMRPWLEDMIDSNSIAGLVWVDKVREKKMFSIPWKHSSHHGWDTDKDASVFKQWAIHTGKFKPGITEPDPKTWKANFRCAMNSLPDIEEVKDKSINKGFEAVSVYRMLQVEKNKNKRSSKSQESRRRKKVRKINADMEETEEHLYAHKQQEMITQENPTDSTESTNTASPTSDVPDCSDYQVEIGPDSTNDIYIGRFLVSPVHTTEYEEKAIVELTRQLELDSAQWLRSSSSGKDFLCNEVALTESYQCPESQRSGSPGEELELRFYTELIPGLPSEDHLSYTDMWNSDPHTTGLPQVSSLLQDLRL